MKRTDRARDKQSHTASVQSFAGGILNKYKTRQGVDKHGRLSLSHKKQSEPSVIENRLRVQVIAPKDTAKPAKEPKKAPVIPAKRIERVIEREKIVERQTVVYRDVQQVIKEHRTVREIAVTQPAVIREQDRTNESRRADLGKTIEISRSNETTDSAIRSFSRSKAQTGTKADQPPIASVAVANKQQAVSDFHTWIHHKASAAGANASLQAANRIERLQQSIANRGGLRGAADLFKAGGRYAPLQLSNARIDRRRGGTEKEAGDGADSIARKSVKRAEAAEAETAKRTKRAELSEAETAKRLKQAEQAQAETAKRVKRSEAAEAETVKRAKGAELSEAETAKRLKQAEAAEAETAKRAKRAEQSEAETAKRVKRAEQSEAETAKRVKRAEQSEAETAKRVKRAEQSEAETTKRVKQAEHSEAETAKHLKQSESAEAETAMKPVGYTAASKAVIENAAKRRPKLEHRQPLRQDSGTDEQSAQLTGLRSESHINHTVSPSPKTTGIGGERPSGGVFRLVANGGELLVTIGRTPTRLQRLAQPSLLRGSDPLTVQPKTGPYSSKSNAPIHAARKLEHRTFKAANAEQALQPFQSVAAVSRQKAAAQEKLENENATRRGQAAPDGYGANRVAAKQSLYLQKSHTDARLSRLIENRRLQSDRAQAIAPRTKGVIVKDGAAITQSALVVLKQTLGKRTLSAHHAPAFTKGIQRHISPYAQAQGTASGQSGNVKERLTGGHLPIRAGQSVSKMLWRAPQITAQQPPTIHRRLSGLQVNGMNEPIVVQRRSMQKSATSRSKPAVLRHKEAAGRASLAEGSTSPAAKGTSPAVKRKSSTEERSAPASGGLTFNNSRVNGSPAATESSEPVPAARLVHAAAVKPEAPPLTANRNVGKQAETLAGNSANRLLSHIEGRTAPLTAASLLPRSAPRTQTHKAGGSAFRPIQAKRPLAKGQTAREQLPVGALRFAERTNEEAAAASPLRLQHAHTSLFSPKENDASSLKPIGAGSYSSHGAMPQLAHHRPKQAAPAEQQRHVQVEAPKELDPEKLQKMIMKMPQLRPEAIADQVYKALERKMKLEQRRRGY